MTEIVRDFEAREPRYRIRAGADVQVTLKVGQDGAERTLIGNLIDLSRGGGKVLVDECLPMESAFLFCMHVPELDIHLEVDSGVRWVRPAEGSDEKEAWLVGCSFEPRFPGQALAELACGGVLERRSSQRVPASLRTTALWELSQDETEVFLMDLSGGGCCLLSDEARGIGERLLVYAVNQDGDRTPTRARVCWRMKTDDGYWIGCSFLDTDAAKRLTESAYRAQLPSSHETSSRLLVYLGVGAVALSLIALLSVIRFDPGSENAKHTRVAPNAPPPGSTAPFEPAGEDVGDAEEHGAPPVAITATPLPEMQDAVPQVPAAGDDRLDRLPPIGEASQPGSDATTAAEADELDAGRGNSIDAPPRSDNPQPSAPEADAAIGEPAPDSSPAGIDPAPFHGTAVSPEADRQSVPLSGWNDAGPVAGTPAFERGRYGRDGDGTARSDDWNVAPRTTAIPRDSAGTAVANPWNDRTLDPLELESEWTPRAPAAIDRRPAETERADNQPVEPVTPLPVRTPPPAIADPPAPVEIADEPASAPPDVQPGGEVPPRKAEAAALHFKAGLEAVERRRYDEAIESFELAAENDPPNALYTYWLAIALYHSDQLIEAEQFVHRAVALEFDEPVDEWGLRMQRVQGRVRVWLEATRSVARGQDRE